MSACVCLSGAGDPRALHPFPTRRSSDLDDVAEKPVRAAMLRILAEQPGILARQGATDRLGRTGVLVSLPYVDAQGVTDRKSTRLNSSHITISYAVFCLKKKKRKTTQRQR